MADHPTATHCEEHSKERGVSGAMCCTHNVTKNHLLHREHCCFWCLFENIARLEIYLLFYMICAILLCFNASIWNKKTGNRSYPEDI